jgi:SAM-dependent methyltransferase
MRAVALELTANESEALVREPFDAVDADLASWNDRMYRVHGTPYDRGLTAYIQKARVAAVLRLASVSEADRVLELGCEAGQLMSRVPRCRRLVGADISGSALADAAERLSRRQPAAELVQADAQLALPFGRGEFDVVICSEMLEHVAYPAAVVEQLHAIVDASTRVVLSVPLEKPKLALKRCSRPSVCSACCFPASSRRAANGISSPSRAACCSTSRAASSSWRRVPWCGVATTSPFQQTLSR